MKTKRKNHEYRLLHATRAYTFLEIAEILHVHIRTVQDWPQRGLIIFNKLSRPFLVMGSEVQRFLKEQRQLLGRSLNPDEFMCLSCHLPRNPEPGRVTVTPTGKRMGKDKIQIISQGICSVYGGKVSRLGTRQLSDANAISAASRVTQAEGDYPLQH